MKNYALRRLSDQPILTTTDVKPSREGWRVLGAFNPAVCRFGDEIIMLLRVAEAPGSEPGWLHIPLIVDAGNGPQLTVKSFREPTGPYDPRVVALGGITYLTSLSHLRLARSRDGIHFTIDEKPFLFPARMDESFGIEDARITFLDDKYWITYTAVSQHGPGVGLAVTTDFSTVERVGMILPPPNKDVCLFPEKINGNYVLLHRPMVSEIGKPSIWLADSPDGVHWGNHRFVFGGRGRINASLADEAFDWEGQKIGAGPEPLLTDEGWLVLYHGANSGHEYALALALLDKNDPAIVLDRSSVPLLTPELSWERAGFFPNVVFSNGWIQWPHTGRIWVYYGAADSGVGLAELLV
ncbi:MAG: glycoside hydrolase family 130 protein [Bacteroidetes bacterium]|nr:glycoside hydrolase family 130 protein [Fibrella sp.]